MLLSPILILVLVSYCSFVKCMRNRCSLTRESPELCHFVQFAGAPA